MDIKLLILLACLVNLYLGILVFKRGWKTKASFGFSIFAWSLALWTLAFYFYEHPFLFSSLILIKIIYLLVFLVVGSLFYFSFYFPIKSARSPFLPLILYSILAIPQIWLLLFTNLWVKEVVDKYWGIATILGPAYIFPSIFWSLFTFWAFFKWFKVYRHIKGLGKMQLRYVFFGTLLFIILTIIVDAIIPLITGESRYFWLSPVFSLFLAGSVAYAILRYRLMDVRLVLRTGLVYFLSIVTLIATVLGAIYFFSWIVDYTPNIGLAVIGGVAMAILLLVFIPLKDSLLKLANKYLFKTVYTTQEALRSLSGKAATIIELDKLIKEIVDTIKKAFGLNNISFLLKEKETFTVKENIGFKEEDIFALIKENPLLAFLEKEKRPLVLEEIEREGVLGNLRKKMEEMNISLILPLFSKGELIGLVILGPKVANESYTKEDLELLETLGSQTAIAIENARIYQEVRDLTENLEQRVRKQTKNIEALSEMKSEFLKVVSHQLNTPVSIINSLSSMLVEGSVKKEKQPEFIKNLYLSSERLTTILDDILVAQGLVGGVEKVNISPSKIDELVGQEVHRFKSRAEIQGIKVSFRKLKETFPITLVDSEMIQRAVRRLIDNAILYTEKGGKVEVSLDLKKDNNKEFIEISVKDNGIGLDEEDKKTLFNLFHRGERATLLHPNGSGLGLFIVKNFIEAHQGKIEVKSEGKDKGSTFIITLPIITEV